MSLEKKEEIQHRLESLKKTSTQQLPLTRSEIIRNIAYIELHADTSDGDNGGALEVGSDCNVKLPVNGTDDLPTIRSKMTTLATKIGFNKTDITKIITAVTEIVRNVTKYAVGAQAEINARRTANGIHIEIWDRGPGISVEILETIMNGTYASKTGLGRGILGSKNIMDFFQILTLVGTQVIMEKHLPK